MGIGEISSNPKFLDGKVSLEYDSSKSVLLKTYFGNISFDDFVASWTEILSASDFSEKLAGVILDFSEAYFDFPANDNEKVVRFFIRNFRFFGKYKIGIVANNPHNIVVAMLIARAETSYCLRPFTTLNAALFWVQSVS